MSTSVATTPVPISIFDETDSLVAIVGLYESAFFERDWQSAGAFQITINLNIPSASEFKRGRTVLFGQDRRRFGIITETIDNIDEQGKGNEKRAVYGYEIKKILDWRMVQPPAGSDYFHYNTFAETVMHNLVKYNADPSFVTDTLRGFYRGDTVALGAILVQESDQGRGPTYLLNSRWNTTILEELAACALATGWGSWIEFNAVGGAGFNWIFRTSGGVNRTASQSVNNRVVFNTDYGTLRTAQATDSDVTYKSLAYVGGQGQGAARTIRTVYDGASAPTSRLRKEMFVDARDLSANADLDSRGALKLSQNYFQIFLDASSLAVSSVVFGIDYDLGDTCTVTQFGMSVDEQITKVRESWSANSYQVDLTFDRKYAEITSLVKSNNTTLQTALSASEVPALVGGYMLVSDSSGHTVESNIAYSPGALTLSTLYGSASASGTLTLSSTSNATKGKILFGTSAYDEVNNYLGIGTSSPSFPFSLVGSNPDRLRLALTNTNAVGSASSAIDFFQGRSQGTAPNWEMGTDRFQNGTNDFYFHNGSDVLYMGITGNVGIGTISPSYTLDVNGSIRTLNYYMVPAVSNSGGGLWSLGNTSWAGNSPASTGITSVSGILYSGGPGSQLFTLGSVSAQMSIQLDGSLFIGDSITYNPASITGASSGCLAVQGTSSFGGNAFFQGNVGIGTTSPSTTTHIYGTLTVDAAGQTLNGYSEGIRLGRASNGYSSIFYGANPAVASGSQAGLWWAGRQGGADNSFVFYSQDYSSGVGGVVFSISNTTGIASSLGLSVASHGASPDNGYGSVGVTNPSDTNSYSYYSMTRAGQIAWQIGINTSRDFQISQGGTGGKLGSALLILNSGGNVGIGTTSPGYTLDVNGSTRISASFACNGATPQAAYNSGGALAAYATGSYGFDTAAHASSLYAMVVSIRAALVADGIMS